MADPTLPSEDEAEKMFRPKGQATELPPPSPPMSQWGPIIGKTYLHSVAPMGGPEYSADVGAIGGGPPAWEAPSAAPAQPKYGGVLGVGQREAEAYGGPFTGFSMAYPGGTLGGSVGGETGRDLGYGTAGDIAGSLLGGAVGGKIADVGRRLAGRALPELPPAAEPVPAVQTLRNVFMDEAGAAIPKTTNIGDMKHALGEAIQTEFKDPNNFTTQFLQSAKARPKAGPEVQYLRDINDAPKPSDALDLAVKQPEFWENLPPKSKSALSAWFAHNVDSDPEAWLNVNAKYRKALLPDEDSAAVITNRAEEAMARAKAATAQVGPAAKPPTRMENLLSLGKQVMPFISKHGAAGVGGATELGLSLMGHMGHPGAEYAAAGAGAATLGAQMLRKYPGSAIAGVANPVYNLLNGQGR